jgi:hypothetical protein
MDICLNKRRAWFLIVPRETVPLSTVYNLIFFVQYLVFTACVLPIHLSFSRKIMILLYKAELLYNKQNLTD